LFFYHGRAITAIYKVLRLLFNAQTSVFDQFEDELFGNSGNSARVFRSGIGIAQQKLIDLFKVIIFRDSALAAQRLPVK
jgi:hypothetical protein